MNTMEFSKVPHLVKHYLNEQEHSNDSFVDFISKHYSNTNPHKKTHGESEEFPFQKNISSFAFNFVIPTTVTIQSNPLEITKNYVSIYKSEHTSNTLDSIWNPPKTA